MPVRPPGRFRLWDRQLDRYPDDRPRMAYFAITLLATVTLYYQAYVQGAVAAPIMREYGFTFTEFTYVGVGALLFGALASLGAGMADRWGRANLVVGGLLLTALLTAFGLPNADGKVSYLVLYVLVAVVEGMALVATPALIRDFSPQLGRAQAMGLWALGPVLGSIAVTQVSSRTLDDHPDWRWQFYVAGVVGLVVFAVAHLGLRELAPKLRDQLMVSARDRALVEAKAEGIDPEQALEGHWRQMLRPDIVGSSIAVSLYLLFYSLAVSFLVLYLATVYGMTEAEGNGIANWYWVPTAITLVVAGVLSDKLRVRKPFIIFGALVSMAGVALFALAATDPETSASSLRLYLTVAGIGQGFVYAAWMAAFTETVEKRNPAATATGLAVWGSTIRLMLMITLAILPFALSATTTLVEDAPRLQAITTEYADQIKVLQTVDPTTLSDLEADPNDAEAQAEALSALTGLPEADVARVVSLGVQYADQLATAKAIDPAVLAALVADPGDAQAGAEAVQQVMEGLGVSQAEAVARLQDLATVPPADLAVLQANGPAVEEGASRLQAVAQIPQSDLVFLRDKGADVQEAVESNPEQWQNWWWVCVLGQLLFLPSVFLLTGRWSPRRARADQVAHEERVEAELAKLEGRALQQA